jgi:4-carboxymuconolactone decarboxylase
MPNRLTLVPRDELPEDERRFRDAVAAIRRRPISGPFVPLLRSSPDLAARVAHLGHYFHARGQADESILSLRVRTFVALIVARMFDIPYEWGAWLGWALQAGLPQETADALRERKPLPSLTSEDALVLDFCRQLLGDGHRLSDATFKAALDHFGVQGIVELACTAGYFAMLGFPLNAFEIEMSSEQKGMRKSFVPLPVAPPEGQPAGRGGAGPVGERRAAPRVPLIRGHDDLPHREHQHFLDRVVRTRGRIAGPFQVLLHSPDVADRVAAVGEVLLYGAALTPRIKALTQQTAAHEWNCSYAWAFSVRNGDASATAGEDGKLLSDFCLQLLRGNHHVSEETYRATVDRFGVPATVQIAATLGYFVMQSCVLNTFQIEPEDDPSALVL